MFHGTFVYGALLVKYSAELYQPDACICNYAELWAAAGTVGVGDGKRATVAEHSTAPRCAFLHHSKTSRTGQLASFSSRLPHTLLARAIKRAIFNTTAGASLFLLPCATSI